MYDVIIHPQVTAFTTAGESKPSQLATIKYTSDRITGTVSSFKASPANDTCVTLTWDLMKDKQVKNYKVIYTDSWGVEQVILTSSDSKTYQGKIHFIVTVVLQ